MGLRHLARQRALQLLYGLEFNDLSYEEAEREFLAVNARRRKVWSPFASRLARLAWQQRHDLEREIEPHLKRWKLARLPLTDRLCLRMALCELKNFPEIPLRVTLNEYIELARLFGGTEDSPQFVNGVLDHIAAQFKHKDIGRDDPGDTEPSPQEAAELMDDEDAEELSPDLLHQELGGEEKR